MNLLYNNKKTILFRFDKGDEVISELSAFAKKENIPSAHFTGLGACQEIILSYYDLKKKAYIDKTFNEDLEIVSLTGNIAWMKNEPVIHAHGVFSNNKFQTFGGHVKKLLVSATCEIHLTKLSDLERAYDEETGLNLLKTKV